MSDTENLSRKERFLKILELLKTKNEVLVDELAQKFSCSQETIRRDLRYLEAQGKLVRTWGGAFTIFDDIGKAFEERKKEHVIAKQVMAAKAARMIAPELTIALDSSTSCFFLAQNLPDVSLRIITNSLRNIDLLKLNHKYEVIGTGGQFDAKHGDFIFNKQNIVSFSSLKIDLCFLSCVGADLYTGLWDMNEGVAELKDELIKSSVHTVLLADSSKFGKKTPFKLCNWNEIDFVIDDGSIAPTYSQKFHELDINII